MISQDPRLFQDRISAAKGRNTYTLDQPIFEPSKEDFRQFGEENWNFPEGSPVISQNHFQPDNQWHAINPHPPIDPDYAEEDLASYHTGRNNEV